MESSWGCSMGPPIYLRTLDVAPVAPGVDTLIPWAIEGHMAPYGLHFLALRPLRPLPPRDLLSRVAKPYIVDTKKVQQTQLHGHAWYVSLGSGLWDIIGEP